MEGFGDRPCHVSCQADELPLSSSEWASKCAVSCPGNHQQMDGIGDKEWGTREKARSGDEEQLDQVGGGECKAMENVLQHWEALMIKSTWNLFLYGISLAGQSARSRATGWTTLRELSKFRVGVKAEELTASLALLPSRGGLPPPHWARAADLKTAPLFSKGKRWTERNVSASWTYLTNRGDRIPLQRNSHSVKDIATKRVHLARRIDACSLL